tara:strand:+ start:1223 stop:1504 length:282 start_codon:yes stop_codon:yes gene_type:complete
MIQTTTIQSEHASKYLTVLCRHFSRKVEAKWDDLNGHVNFPMGEATMRVEEDNLLIQCKAEDEHKLKGVIAIIESHVHLFSRRETITLQWHSA